MPAKAALPSSDEYHRPSFAKLRLAILVPGVWISFVLFGKAQEALTRTEFGSDGERFRFTTFLVLAQSLGNSLVAATILLLRYGSRVRFGAGVATRDWLIVALGYLGAHKFGLWSLLYIPFPLQVLVKSCKTVPVMLGEVAFGAAKITAKKLVGVAMLTFGIALFMLFRDDKKKKMAGMADFDYFSADMAMGCLLVLGALVCDGIYGPYQNKIIQDARARVEAKAGEAATKGTRAEEGIVIVPSAHHLMFNMNFWQGLFALLMIACHWFATGYNEVDAVQKFISRNPDCLRFLVIFVGAMAIGNLFIYQLQRDFGALVVTLTTTVRKLISVLISSLPASGLCHIVDVPFCSVFSGFGNAINMQQWVGVAIVFSSKFTAGFISENICSATSSTVAKGAAVTSSSSSSSRKNGNGKAKVQ